jgi:hypothetical protein
MTQLMYVCMIGFVFMLMINGMLQVRTEDYLIATSCRVFGQVTIDGTTFICEVKK